MIAGFVLYLRLAAPWMLLAGFLAAGGAGGTLHFARCTRETAIELRADLRKRLDAVLQGIQWQFR